jgi:hypothetical protein
VLGFVCLKRVCSCLGIWGCGVGIDSVLDSVWFLGLWCRRNESYVEYCDLRLKI